MDIRFGEESEHVKANITETHNAYNVLYSFVMVKE